MTECLCPYCGAEVSVVGDEEGMTYSEMCPDCGKLFTYEVEVELHYTSEKAPCLNGGKHQWRPTITFPRHMVSMQCKYCREERTPSDEERKKHNIPRSY